MATSNETLDESLAALSPGDVQECKQLFEQGGLKACESFLHKKAEDWKTVPLNIAIIGNSGTGKSSFINTIRGLNGDDEGAAEVGVTETTSQPTPYYHPENAMLKIWDLPGVGTPNFPRDTYLDKIDFTKYDFFLILSCDRFTENDIWMARAIAKKEKCFFFIRTKIHTSITDDKEAHPKSHKKDMVLAKIRDNIRDNLGELYVEKKVFLIDNHKRALYDFALLEVRLIQDFPSLKRCALILSLNALSEQMVKLKVTELRRLIWVYCCMSGFGAAIPLPGLSAAIDLKIIMKQSHSYFHQLGLDNESLINTAKIYQCEVKDFQEIVAKYRNLLTKQGILDLLSNIITLAFAAKIGARFIPLVGFAIAFPISYFTTYKLLNEILTKMEEVALLVVKAVLESSSNIVDKLHCDDNEDGEIDDELVQ